MLLGQEVERVETVAGARTAAARTAAAAAAAACLNESSGDPLLTDADADDLPDGT